MLAKARAGSSSGIGYRHLVGRGQRYWEHPTVHRVILTAKSYQYQPLTRSSAILVWP